MAVFALVDCNNFYASCERAFNPALDGRPVVVLSNNDGCVIARSNEAKAVGIRMGDPWFKIRSYAEKNGVIARSSNYALYGDMSERVMSILADAAPASEVYSIDEAFLELGNLACVDDLTEWCRALRARVRRWTGIPVSIGVGPTKTLAKIANRLAKKSTRADGVLDLVKHRQHVGHALQCTDVADVWGIGGRWAAACYGAGIRSAHDLAQAPENWVRARMGAVGLRTLMELRGIAVHTLETQPAARQTCCCSRSFGDATGDRRHVADAITAFAERAAEKIRNDGLVARTVQAFIQTDRFRPDLPQYSCSASAGLESHTAATPAIIAAAQRAFGSIWREGFEYKKAGVLLLDLARPEDVPRSLFDVARPTSAPALMHAVDAINSQFGRGSVSFGQAAADAPWRMRREALSPSYTTRWKDIPSARC